jgi:hypothetical protein
MSVTERLDKQRFGHEAISSHISGIEALYSSSNISINDSHQLFSLLSDAKELASEWAIGNIDGPAMDKLFSAIHIQRIHNGIRLLEFEESKAKYLKDLLNGSLDFFDRGISHAKSILWELEAYTKIKKVIPESALDEPDVVININQLNIALPCKKIFSKKGVSKVLSNAVSQIEKRHEFGIVALNIDNLMPEKCLLVAKTFQEAADRLHAHNTDFLSEHERHFLKYLSTSRIVAVLASTSVITDTLEDEPKFNNFSQWAIWTIPDLKPEHKNAIDEFRGKVIG